MCGVEVVPLVHEFSRSDRPEERALFVRVYLDFAADCGRRDLAVPRDWRQALQNCLEKASAAERDVYLADIAEAYASVRPAPDDGPLGFATGDDIDAIVALGRLDRLIALAADRKARLRAEHFELLVACALTLAQHGDRRLVEALLSRDPIRFEAAPLFLEASSEQRAAILVAAQRAVLGRMQPGAGASLCEETASQLEFAAIAGDANEFALALAEALGADPALAERISADPAGEPLAVALIALGAPRDVAVRIMTARDMQDGEGYRRIQTMARLGERVSPAAAQRIVAALLGRPQAPLEMPAPYAREATNPSPFLRREAPARKASPAMSERSARGSQRP